MDVMLSWIDSAQALLLVLLASAGLHFVWKRSQWKRGRRAEFYLCAWLVAALAFHISRGHPNFERYYLLTLPFLVTLACAGLYAVGSRMVTLERPFWPAAFVCLLTAIGLTKALYQTRHDYHWSDAEDIARKMNQVTPPGGKMYTDEFIYFLTRRPPPSGMEHADSHKLNLAPATMAELHVVSKQQLEKRLKAGEFDTVETWEEEDKIKELGLPAIYQNKAVLHDATIFWGKKKR
jgi:hypothetical protein